MPRRPDMPPLRREDLDPDPIAQFRTWFALAEREVPLPEAISLATVDAEGAPDARMVLLKGVDDRGFRFYTNAASAKGRQMDGAPRAALIAYWRELDRQVRVRGAVEPLGTEECDRYFASRDRDSQLGAWASPQSEPIADRAELDRRLEEVRERFEGVGEIPRPESWRGFLVAPATIEFWQGQMARLHDRFIYRRAAGADGGEGGSDGGEWAIERLAP